MYAEAVLRGGGGSLGDAVITILLEKELTVVL